MNRILRILPAYWILPVVLTMASCAGSGAASEQKLLVPVGVGTHTMQGRSYVSVDGIGVRYDVAFAGFSDQRLLFDVQIVNLTDRPMTVGPEDFYYLASRDTAWTGTRFPTATKSFGMNPAGERATIDTMIALENESLRAAQGTGEYERLSENHDESLATLRRLRSQWDGVLETMTIPPGGKGEGRLAFFPRPEFRTVRLHFPRVDSARAVIFGMVGPAR